MKKNFRLLRIIFTTIWLIVGLIFLFLVSFAEYSKSLDFFVKTYIFLVPIGIWLVAFLRRKERQN